jgi:hypothetical protein
LFTETEEQLSPCPGAASVRSRKTEKLRNARNLYKRQPVAHRQKISLSRVPLFSIIVCFVVFLQENCRDNDFSSSAFFVFVCEDWRKTQAQPWTGRCQEQKEKKARKRKESLQKTPDHKQKQLVFLEFCSSLHFVYEN